MASFCTSQTMLPNIWGTRWRTCWYTATQSMTSSTSRTTMQYRPSWIGRDLTYTSHRPCTAYITTAASIWMAKRECSCVGWTLAGDWRRWVISQAFLKFLTLQKCAKTNALRRPESRSHTGPLSVVSTAVQSQRASLSSYLHADRHARD